MTESKLLREIARLHRELDERMKAFPKVCCSGCCACCHQHVRIVAVEEIAITHYVKTQMSATVKQRVHSNLHSWLDYFDRNTPAFVENSDLSKFEEQQQADRFPCPFLLDSKCTIYAVRPIACRSYIQPESAANCDRNPFPSSPALARAAGTFAATEICRLIGRQVQLRSLCLSVAQTFEIQKTRKLKVIFGIIGGTLKAH